MGNLRLTALCGCMAALVLSIAPWAASQELQASSLSTADAQDLVGDWTVSMDFQGRNVPMNLTVGDVDGKAGARIDMRGRTIDVTEITKTDSGYTLTYPVEFGGQEMQLTMELAVAEDKSLSGTLSDSGGFFNAAVQGGPAEAGSEGGGDSDAPRFDPDRATDLATEDAQEYIGGWDLEAEMRGNKVNMKLILVDVEGQVGGLLTNNFQPDPQVIERMEMTEEGLKMSYPADFGGQAMEINVVAKVEGDNVTGTFGDSGGFFSAPFEGTRGEGNVILARGSAGTEEEEARRARRRNRGGGSARLTVAGNEIQINFGGLKTDSEDYEAFKAMKPGDVFRFVGGRATKIKNDADLVFGDTVIEAGNAHESYPGVYSVWLKKTDNGWSLVFNEHADIWGTQRLPEADVAEVPLTLSKLDEEQATFNVELKEAGENEGLLRLAWGDQEWKANFKVAQ